MRFYLSDMKTLRTRYKNIILDIKIILLNFEPILHPLENDQSIPAPI